MNDPAARSIDAWPTFVFACRAAARNAFPLFAAFGMFLLPELGLYAIAAPTLSGAMFDPSPRDVPLGEYLAFTGILILVVLSAVWSTIVTADLADHALAGQPLPRLGDAFAHALGRMPAVLVAYAIVFGVVIAPLIPLFVLMALTIEPSGGVSPIPALSGLVLGLLVVLPVVVALGMFLRFGPIRAAIRDEGPITAIRGGIALVRGRFWRALGYVVLVSIAVQLAMSALKAGAVLVHGMQSMWGFLLLGLALTAALAFQVVHEVALMRRLEDANAPPTEAPDDVPEIAG